MDLCSLFDPSWSSRNAILCLFDVSGVSLSQYLEGDGGVPGSLVYKECQSQDAGSLLEKGQSQASLRPVSGQSQASPRPVSGQSQAIHRYSQSQASLRPVSGQSEVSQMSVRGESQVIRRP